jgi:hypothetical protein
MHNPTENDLDWLAFRYISGEMSVNEAGQFESLLADDQNARDAVVRAVELSQTILATQISPQSESIGFLSAVSKSWMQHVTWISTSVAALLLIALALNFHRPMSVSESDDIASAWAESSTEPVSDAATFSEDDEFVTADPPNWMLEAVRSLHGDESPESDDSGDEEMES